MSDLAEAENQKASPSQPIQPKVVGKVLSVTIKLGQNDDVAEAIKDAAALGEVTNVSLHPDYGYDDFGY